MRVGSEIEASCRKCGDVWHIIVALAEGRIAQVECGRCGGRHRYRGDAGSTRRRSRTGAAAPRGRGVAPKSVVEADLSHPRRPFRVSETYQVGERIVHATFGEGVVQAVAGAKKIEVLFEVGSKILVHGRSPT